MRRWGPFKELVCIAVACLRVAHGTWLGGLAFGVWNLGHRDHSEARRA